MCALKDQNSKGEAECMGNYCARKYSRCSGVSGLRKQLSQHQYQAPQVQIEGFWSSDGKHIRLLHEQQKCVPVTKAGALSVGLSLSRSMAASQDFWGMRPPSHKHDTLRFYRHPLLQPVLLKHAL